VDGDGIDDFKHTMKKKKKKKAVFEIKVPVYEFEGGAPAGDYSFPFAYTLPDFCPSSFYAHHHR
jgi:hypothetical protein